MLRKLWRASEGVKTPHNKKTADMATVSVPDPDYIVLPLQQHIGAPAKPLVKKGDSVDIGMMVAESNGFVSSPIYSGVSGTVRAIEKRQLAGTKVDCIIIDNDREARVSPDIKPPVVNDYETFTEAVSKSGLVGLGGAGFPTFIKLKPKDLSAVDTLVINAAECEPYITSDNREMLECADHVMTGIMLVKRYLNIKNVYIGIENNKPQAIELMMSMAAGDKNIKVISLESRYPQGAEKVLIENITGRQVPEGGLPANVGVIVLSVTTTSFISKYIETGVPLIKKRLTVDGDAIKSPKNVEAIIGTPVQNIIDFCGGYSVECGKLILGGPMMGVALPSAEVPILKQTNAVLAFSHKMAEMPDPTPCIGCARCISACPMGLSPVEIVHAYELADRDKLKMLKISSCIECGCCSYTCPAKRPLTPTMKLAKIVEKTGGV